MYITWARGGDDDGQFCCTPAVHAGGKARLQQQGYNLPWDQIQSVSNRNTPLAASGQVGGSNL